jgi:hypothetical protein
MSNPNHRFTLSVIHTHQSYFDTRSKRISSKPTRYYIIGVGKADGCRGALLGLNGLKHNLEHGNVKPSNYNQRNIVELILHGFKTTDQIEYIGAFRTIQEIVDIIEVLQL